MTKPIEVTEGTLNAQLLAVATSVLPALGLYALSRGWIDSALLKLITEVLGVTLPLLAVRFAHKAKAQRIEIAEAAPNHVAQVVPKRRRRR